MDSHPVPRRALYWTLAVLAGPFAGVLLALVLAGEMTPGAAAVAAVVATAALWLTVRRHLSGLARIADRIAPLPEPAPDGIRRLRKALNDGGRSDVIRTVRSAGYGLEVSPD